MLLQIKSLLVIQDRDHKIKSLQLEIEKIPRDAAAIKARLDDAQSKADSARDTIIKNELAIKKIDLERMTRRTTMDRLATQQFETKKSDEFAALGAELIRYQDMVNDLENQEFELMEKSDELALELEKANEKLTSVKASMVIEIKILTEKKANHSIRITELKDERAALSKEIDGTTLAIYDRVFAKKGNTAVSPLHNNQCGGCHMKVIQETISKTIKEEQLSQCENCGCFLYSV